MNTRGRMAATIGHRKYRRAHSQVSRKAAQTHVAEKKRIDKSVAPKIFSQTLEKMRKKTPELSIPPHHSLNICGQVSCRRTIHDMISSLQKIVWRERNQVTNRNRGAHNKRAAASIHPKGSRVCKGMVGLFRSCS